MATKIWDIFPYDIKSYENLNSLKKKIRNWKSNGCHCRLCKQYVHGVGYVDTFYYIFIVFNNYFYFLRCK